LITSSVCPGSCSHRYHRTPRTRGGLDARSSSSA
jgi:hypothetical protein